MCKCVCVHVCRTVDFTENGDAVQLLGTSYNVTRGATVYISSVLVEVFGQGDTLFLPSGGGQCESSIVTLPLNGSFLNIAPSTANLFNFQVDQASQCLRSIYFTSEAESDAER